MRLASSPRLPLPDFPQLTISRRFPLLRSVFAVATPFALAAIYDWTSLSLMLKHVLPYFFFLPTMVGYLARYVTDL